MLEFNGKIVESTRPNYFLYLTGTMLVLFIAT